MKARGAAVSRENASKNKIKSNRTADHVSLAVSDVDVRSETIISEANREGSSDGGDAWSTAIFEISSP